LAMLIFRCDHCGDEARSDQIVGREFDYIKHGYVSFTLPGISKKDFCGECRKLLAQAIERGHHDENDRKLELIADVLSRQPEKPAAPQRRRFLGVLDLAPRGYLKRLA
jgi:hypothetical protein